MWELSERVAICNPGKESSQATNPACTLFLDFSDFKTVNVTFFCLSHWVCGILLHSLSWLVQVPRGWMWRQEALWVWSDLPPGNRRPVSSPSNLGPGKPWQGQRGTIIFPLNFLSTFLKSQVTLFVWLHSWTFYSVLLTFMSIPSLILYCVNYCIFIMSLELF